MKHEAEIQQQAIAETPCTEAAPCFACLRCFVALTNILATDPNVRAHMTGVETRPAWKPAWKRVAEAGGLLPSADAYRVGPLSAERTITLTAAHVATLPTGERVELPAGTVLREATPEDAVPPRCTGKRSANAGTTGIECDDYACNVHGRGAIRRLHETAPSVAPPNTVREEDDTGVRFVDRSQAMIDRNKRALETWNIAAHKSDLPDPPIGSGCLVYSCWTPCAPGHQHCARHGGADATLLHAKTRT